VATLSVVVITRNEARRIRRCLESCAWADELVVVDSGSDDGTVEICREFTPHVHVRPFDRFDRQKNFGLDMATSEWVLALDADEVVSPALRDEIRQVVAAGGDHAAFVLRRQNLLCGQPIDHAWGRDALVRLMRRGRGRFHNAVHEKVEVDGPVGELAAPLLHFNSEDLQEWIAKNQRYVGLEARERVQRGERFRLARALLSPLRVFLFRYVGLGGLRDGRMGLVLCVSLAFFTFLLHARLRELETAEPAP
jgi:glycosyltransferase involved in cell wall biosynthesis